MDIALIIVIIVFLIPIGILIKKLIPYFTTKKGFKKYNEELSTHGPKLYFAPIIGIILAAVLIGRFDLIIGLFKEYPVYSIFLLIIIAGVLYSDYRTYKQNKNKKS